MITVELRNESLVGVRLVSKFTYVNVKSCYTIKNIQNLLVLLTHGSSSDILFHLERTNPESL